MRFWTFDHLKRISGGSWATAPAPGDRTPEGLSTDTRTLRPGQIFLALRGERFDGHAFARAAAGAGAALLILEDGRAAPGGVPALVVADARRTLARLAADYRRTLERTRVIAVAGSNGKTTTVRLLHAALGASLRGSAPPRSYNNDIGVPLTILAARPDDDYLICEVGTNAPGEIDRLAQIVGPDLAVITSIGREHLEGLGTLEGVAREQASLLEHLTPGGCAVAPAACPHLQPYLACAPELMTFGREPGADARVTAFEQGLTPRGPSLRLTLADGASFTIPLAGEHNALNAAAVVAVARRLGLADADIARGLASAEAAPGRLNLRSIAGLTIVDDSYNANPESMLASLRTFSALAPGSSRRVAILGDMLELGEASQEAHEEVGRALADAHAADLFIAVGHHMLHAAEQALRRWPEERVEMFSGMDDRAARRIASLLKPGDWVLLKASRGMRLERLLEALDAHAEHAARAG